MSATIHMNGNIHRNNDGIECTPEIKELFPAVFSHRKSTQVSEDYQFHDSAKIIEQMLDSNMKLVELSQERLRSSTVRQPHTQLHAMRFQSKAFKKGSDFGINDSVPEIIIMNNHDGRFRFRALAGVFRFVCANGMIVGDQVLGNVAKRHFGKENTFEKTRAILADMPKVVDSISKRIVDWASVTLDKELQEKFARSMISSRGCPDWVKEEQVLRAQRPSENPRDNGVRDLWTTFNVLQENLTNTKLQREGGEGRARGLSPIHGTFSNYRVNRDIWNVAEGFLEDLRSGRQDFSTMTGPELVAEYNRVAAAQGLDQIKRFATREAGIKRLEALAVVA